ncbi:MAG: cytochrome c [Candidatus Binatia bacterium]
MVKKKSFWVGLFSLVLLFTFSQLFAQGDVIKTRRKLMKSNSKAYKAVKKAAKAKDFAAIEKNATILAANMEKIPNLFPKGSTSEKSRAKAAIWKKWNSFTGKAKSIHEVAAMLAESAKAKDGAKVAVLAKGIRCKGCHKKFRKPKKKKK